MKKTMMRLKKQGVSGILDYAAEGDVLVDKQKDKQDMQKVGQWTCNRVVARVYDYASEEQCDR